ncbi:FAS1-like dehydratase domain-containing protein [Streptosporangium sp. NPDC002607]
MPGTAISEPMRAAVGSELGRRVSFAVSESDIRRWASAVYWPEQPPRLFWDVAYAAGTRHGGIVAPEDFNPFAWMCAEIWASGATADADPNDPDRTELLLGIEGPGLKFMLNGGMTAEYGERIRPGDVITSVNRLESYSEREGRLGLMLMTVTEDTWTRADGVLVKRNRNTLIRY